MAQSEVVIVPYKDGPYLVRGPVVLRDQTGEPVVLSRHPVALCRCGKSQIRPFCDGTHQTIRFRAPSQPEVNPAPGSDSASPVGGDDPPRREHELVQAGLLRAQRILTAALRNPERAKQPAIDTARALIVAAVQLLQMQRANSPAPASAVLFLIKGALRSLEADLGAAPATQAEAVAELRQAADLLAVTP